MGAVIFAALGVYAPDVLDWFLNVGDWLADQIYHLDLISTQVRNVIRFLIDAQQMVFLIFVVASRIVVSMIGSIIGIRT
jgi:hypothetical protein